MIRANNILRKMRGNKMILFSSVILLLTILCGTFAGIFAPFSPYDQDLTHKLKPPLWRDPGNRIHLLGTDQLGRDVLSRILYGVRVSLVIGILAVAISAVFGVVLGLLSGFYGGFFDDLIMRIADVQLAIPLILLAISVIVVLGSNMKVLVLVIGLTQWMSYARMVRGETLSLREKDFVRSAYAVGATDTRIILRYILPNTLSSVMVLITLNMATVIVLEAGLSFLGLGIQPPEPSLGTMLSESKNYLSRAWWLSTFPGVTIMTIILAINLFGDGLRDVFDPRLENY
ncbi:MAG: ABC transporter permease [Deltaproteobacteria bacterium]|nr:ABC transporter permease [Deltaproteobacteria bacterium]MBW2129218.1 ABC transporter permease [Deltaproteobacteria bacterium]MBW2303360.1 ABC transporter permease [Deltaproteobacteria bacterium]